MRTRSELETAVFRAIHKVAPEADPKSVPKDVDIRDALDIDSMDFLAFATALHQDLGVDIQEKDFAKIRTIDGAVDYLVQALR